MTPELVFQGDSLAVARMGPTGGVVVAEAAGQVYSGWAAGDLGWIDLTRLAAGTAPDVAADGAGHALAVWEADGAIWAATGSGEEAVRWKKARILGSGSSPEVGWDGLAFQVAWQDGPSIARAPFAKRVGEVTHLDGAKTDLACGAGCALEYWTGESFVLVDPEGEHRLQGEPRIARAPEGTWLTWPGRIAPPAGPVATGYRMGPAVALEVRGALLDWYMAEEGGLFRAEVQGDQWRAVGVGVPGEPATGLAVDRQLAVWWACAGPARRARSGFTDRVSHAGWDPAAAAAAAASAGVVAVGTVADGGVRLDEILRGSLHPGDWIAASGDHAAGESVILVTPPGRLTAEAWSVLGTDARPAVDAALASGGCVP